LIDVGSTAPGDGQDRSEVTNVLPHRAHLRQHGHRAMRSLGSSPSHSHRDNRGGDIAEKPCRHGMERHGGGVVLHTRAPPDVALDAGKRSPAALAAIANRCTFVTAEGGWGRCLNRRRNDDVARSVSASPAGWRRAAWVTTELQAQPILRPARRESMNGGNNPVPSRDRQSLAREIAGYQKHRVKRLRRLYGPGGWLQ